MTAELADEGAVSEARVVVSGEPVDGPEPLFVGSLGEAIEYVHALTPEQQAEVSIFTDGRVYDPKEV